MEKNGIFWNNVTLWKKSAMANVETNTYNIA